LQLLDALQRLETVDRRFQERSRTDPYQSLLVGGYEKPSMATLEGRHMSQRTVPSLGTVTK
jgi:hypothetical protein